MRSVILPLVLVLFAPTVQAAERERLKEVLGHCVLDSDTIADETRQFIVARVPAVPRFKDVSAWDRYAKRLRQDVMERILFRGRAAEWRDAEVRTEWLDETTAGPDYRIRKLRYEALPGLWIPALLYEPLPLSGKVPVALNVNGHDPEGKAASYKQLRSINLAKRGMLVLSVEWFGMGQLATPGFLHYRLNQIDLCGTSGLAPFYLAMSRALDLLLRHERADHSRVTVAGLSGGGWQTMLIAALDPRVTLANPVAGYSSFHTAALNEDFGDSEQSPSDMATVADYAHLTALRAPRPTLLTYNAQDDCCFRAAHALEPLLNAAGLAFALHGRANHLRWHVNYDPGTHNFDRNNREALYRMLGDFFFADDEAYRRTEIPSNDELKTADELFVPLPKENLDFNRLARRLCAELPAGAKLPERLSAVSRWQKHERARLARIVRAEDYAARAERVGGETGDELSTDFWRIHLDDTWSVPAVELTAGEPAAAESHGTTIVVADGGRISVVDDVDLILSAGRHVLAVDLFYFGEARIDATDPPCTYALMLDAVGRRPLGLQVSQLIALARWVREKHGGEVRIEAHGPRNSTIALVAAALEPEAIDCLALHEPLGSFKQLIEQNRSADEMPEMFCFGLLEAFDVAQLLALVAPRQIELHELSPRARSEFTKLEAWCRRLDYPIELVD